MNKKKLCATLTLSAFAASPLPGMAFAAAGDLTLSPAGNVAPGTQTITFNADEGDTWISKNDKVIITYGNGNKDISTNFSISLNPCGPEDLEEKQNAADATLKTATAKVTVLKTAAETTKTAVEKTTDVDNKNDAVEAVEAITTLLSNSDVTAINLSGLGALVTAAQNAIDALSDDAGLTQLNALSSTKIAEATAAITAAKEAKDALAALTVEAASVTLKPSTKVLDSGNYKVTISNTDCATDATQEIKDKKAVGNFTVAGIDIIDIQSAVTVKSDGNIAANDIDKAGVLTAAINGEATELHTITDQYVTTVNNSKISAATVNSGSLEISADKLVSGKYYATTKTGGGTVLDVLYYGEKAEQEAKAASNAVATTVNTVVSAIPSTLTINVAKDETMSILTKIRELPAVVKALNNANMAYTTITLKEVSGDLKTYVTLSNGSTNIYDKTAVTGVVTYEVTLGGVTKTAKTTLTVQQIKTSFTDVVKAYVTDNKLENYNDTTTPKTAALTVNKDDVIKVGSFDYLAEGASAIGNIKLGIGDVQLGMYIDEKTGKVISAPTNDAYREKMDINFIDKDGNIADTINVTITVNPSESGDFDPTKDYTEDQLNDMTDAQLTEVKTYADQQKADTLAARKAKSDAAAQAYLDQNLDLTKPADLQKATQLYLSYSAERKAYKNAKAYAALVDTVIAGK